MNYYVLTIKNFLSENFSNTLSWFLIKLELSKLIEVRTKEKAY